MISRELIIRNQQVMTLDYFNPENIKARVQFEFQSYDKPEEEKSDEEQTEAKG